MTPRGGSVIGPWLSTKQMQELLARLLRGESLTIEEQRAMVTSHEQLRAKLLVTQRDLKTLNGLFEEERSRVDRLLEKSVEQRRDENDTRGSRIAARFRKKD